MLFRLPFACFRSRLNGIRYGWLREQNCETAGHSDDDTHSSFWGKAFTGEHSSLSVGDKKKQE